jgi:hypothetical protein
MIGSRKEIARLQSDFYRDYYHKVLWAILGSTGCILLLILAIIYFLVFIGAPQYYGTATSGQIIPMVIV